MGILFKPRKIRKLQAGGTMPVYRTYNVKQAQQGQDNPAMLLKKYAGSAPPTSKNVKDTGEKDKGRDLVSGLEGLSTDIKAVSSEILKQEQIIKDGYRALGSKFYQTPEYRKADSKLSYLQLDVMPRMKNVQKTVDNNVTKLGDEKASGHGATYYTEGNQVHVEDKDGNHKLIPIMDLRDNEGNLKYNPLTRYEANKRRSTDPKYSIVQPGMERFAMGISSGNTVTNIMENTVDKLIGQAGATSGAVGTDVDQYITDENGNEIKTTVKKYDLNKDNIQQIMDAKDAAYKRMASDGSMDILRMDAVMNVSKEQIEEAGSLEGAVQLYIDDLMYKSVASKTNVTTEDIDNYKLSAKKAPAGAGGVDGTGTPGDLGDYAAESFGLNYNSAKPVTLTVNGTDGNVVEIDYDAQPAVNTGSLITPGTTLKDKDNEDLGRVLNLDEASTVNGMLTGNIDNWQSKVITTNKPVKRITPYTKDGIIVSIKTLPMYKEFEKEYIKALNIIKNNAHLDKDPNETMSKITQKKVELGNIFSNKLKAAGYKQQAGVMTTVMIGNDAIPDGIRSFDPDHNQSTDNNVSIIKGVSMEDGLSFNFGPKLLDGSGQTPGNWSKPVTPHGQAQNSRMSGDNDTPEEWAASASYIDVFIPYNSTATLQGIDGKVKIDRSKLNFESLDIGSKHSFNSGGAAMTAEGVSAFLGEEIKDAGNSLEHTLTLTNQLNNY